MTYVRKSIAVKQLLANIMRGKNIDVIAAFIKVFCYERGLPGNNSYLNSFICNDMFNAAML